MKKTIKILGILLIIILALLFTLPLIFQGKISELARTEINKNLNAKVDFKKVSLSLITSFPNFKLEVKELTITGLQSFEGDTLAYVPSIAITLDVMSVIKGSTYSIKKINIQSPSISIKVLSDGSANYNIALESGKVEEESTVTTDEDGDFLLSLQRFQIKDAYILYTDEQGNMHAAVNNLNFTLSGNLSADQTTLKTNTNIDQVSFTYEGVPYLNKTQVSYKADINADLKNEIYTLKKNSLSLNELMLVFDGSVAMVNEDINIVMAFDAPKTNFKHILSLIPAVYTNDFSSIKTSGKIGINGHIKGLYNENNLPAFNVKMDVSDGTFKYPDLPQSVTDVNIMAEISNIGGDADNTVVDISQFHLQLGNNPVDMQLHVKTPVSDPDLKGKMKGKIDLSTVQEFYPLENDEDLSGIIIADVSLSGKMSAVENEQYESFTAIGSVLLKDLEYKSSYTNDPVRIANAQLNFSPQYLDLVSFQCAIGENDIKASGKIEDYLSYALGDNVLKGQFSTQSEYLNINQLVVEESEVSSETEQSADTSDMTIIEVPGKIDFVMTSTFDKLIYDKLEMENVNGILTLKDNSLTLQNLSMNILDGEMVVSGNYTTVDPGKPEFDFDLNIKNLDIQQACNTFDMIDQYAPIARKTSGTFSTTLNMKSTLDQQMSPIYESMTGGGRLQTTALGIQDVNTLNKIADALKFDPLRNLSVEKILILFEFVDGKILLEPFDIKNNNFDAQMAGWTALDQSIAYTMNMNVPRASFGTEANQVLDNLVSQANQQGAYFSLGETVSLDVLIGGTLSAPEIKTNLKESGKDLVEDVKKKVEEEIQKQKEELTRQAKEEAQKIIDEADKQAEKIIAEAKKQANVIRKNAGDASKQVRDETEKQAKAVEAEGKKKGFLAEAAAKETARQMRKEADKQANKLEDEADKQAKALVKKAQDEAKALKQNAQKEADKILSGN